MIPFIKYPKIERFGGDDNKDILARRDDPIYIQEKIDGGNAQFRIVALPSELIGVLYGSRTRYLQKGQGQFTANIQWLDSRIVSAHAMGETPRPQFIYYGEWCRKHTINYDWKVIPPFLGFDIWDIDARLFLPWPVAQDEFARLGIPTVPCIWSGRASELQGADLLDLLVKSAYRDGPCEGIVIKNYNHCNIYGRQLFAKWVSEEFKEVNKLTFGGASRPKDETSRFLLAYYTPARIIKTIHRLVIEEGHPLGRSLMHLLPRSVAEDIWTECYWEVIKEFGHIDFATIKKNAPKLCLQTLDEYIADYRDETRELANNV
jgi:hypothetical protein